MLSKISKFLVLTFVLTFIVGLLPSQIFATEEPSILISEVQTGDVSSDNIELPASEFIELKNITDDPLILDELKVEYLFGNGNFDRTLATLDGIVEPQDYILLAHVSYLTEQNVTVDFRFGSGTTSILGKTIGQIRLVSKNDVIIDWVAWGNSTTPSEWPRLPAITPGYSVKRILPDDLLYGSGFSYTASTLPVTPQGGGYLANSPSGPGDDSQGSDGGMGGGSGDDTPQNSCDGVTITEILPNPSGSDSGHEFIELYNPTASSISLAGCKMQTTANSKIYTFGAVTVKPKEYKAFYDDFTGLTLSNSSGGSVYLIDTDNSEREFEYIQDMDDDTSWAIDLSGDTWSITYSPTPGKENKIVEIKPCPTGQFRNLETNRCNKIEVEASLGLCPAGKFRNPETNRCKSILSASSLLKPCSPGQFRNPETNRCKSASSSSSLVPCKPDQERNPETNRCRKTTDPTSNNDQVKDVLSISNAKNQTSWAMAGFSFAGATAYAVWEWRSEMWEKLLGLKNKLGIK